MANNKKCFICGCDIYDGDSQIWNRDGFNLCSEECKDDYLDMPNTEILIKKKKLENE